MGNNKGKLNKMEEQKFGENDLLASFRTKKVEKKKNIRLNLPLNFCSALELFLLTTATVNDCGNVM